MSGWKLDRTTGTHWGLLRAGADTEGGLEIPTLQVDVSTVAGPVRLALGANGESRLLLPLARGDSPASIDAGAALSISVSSFKYRGRRLRFLDLICMHAELEAVFEDVVDEILARIDHGDSCADAAQSTIEDFRALLISTAVTDIGTGRIAGLIGELLVLGRLLDHSPSAWRAWRGPTGDRHDFRAGDTSLEVKATLRSDASLVAINGLEQLAVPSGGTLHLLRIVLEPVNGGILSVSSLVRSAMLRADEPSDLRALLAAVGCRDADSKAWNRLSFRSESESLYEVRRGFPRMTQAMLREAPLPAGVHDVTYKIDLSVAETFLCDATAYRDLEARLCS